MKNDPDDLYVSAKKIVIESGQTNAAILGRMLKVSYARAFRLLEKMKEEGIFSSENTVVSRKVIGK